MKKAITILAVLALVIGFAFANDPTTSNPDNQTAAPRQETHVIRIKSVVANIRPVFQLVLTGATSNVSAVNTSGFGSMTNAGDAANNLTPNRFTGDNDYNPYDDDNAVDIGFSLSEGGSVTFVAQLGNATNTCERYNLQFSGGEFTGIKRYNRESENKGPSKIEITTGTVPDSGIDSIEKGSANDVNVNFKGQIPSTTTLPLTLATAKFVYDGDKTIDSDTYYADVSMTVTSI